MFFASDNWAGAHPFIAERLAIEAKGFAAAYGTSDLDKKVEARFSEIFEREVAVFFVATGTAANSLSLAALGRPGGVVFAHSEAHVIEDECGAPDFLSGLRMVPVDGQNGRIDPDNLVHRIHHYPQNAVHRGRAAAVTITQATEIGTVYSLDEIETIASLAHHHQIPLHMDGARFANALVALDASPADMTWRRGVDVVSFGATKNGCWCAEAIVFFDPARAKDLPFMRKRSAQLFSKSRFIAAQFDAYFENDLWLDLARHANRMADRLRDKIAHNPATQLAWPTVANEVFAIVPQEAARMAEERGAKFYEWPVPEAYRHAVKDHETLIRLVTSFATTDADVENLLRCFA